jgi:hypothetical protein
VATIATEHRESWWLWIMAEEYEALLSNFTATSEGNEQDILAIEQEYGISLPSDYRSFLIAKSGGEGFVGEQYLILWHAHEVIPFNHDYEVKEYAPGLLLFGSNGGGEGFAYDLRKQCGDIVMVPFIGMDLENAKSISSTFIDFLRKLKVANGELL